MVGSQGIYRHTSPRHQRIAGMGSERPDTGRVEQNVRQQQRQDTIERRLGNAQTIAAEKFRKERRSAATRWASQGRDHANQLAVASAPRTPSKVIRDELSRCPLPVASHARSTADIFASLPDSSRRRRSPTPELRGQIREGTILPEDVGSPKLLAPRHTALSWPPRWWGESISPATD